MSCIRLSFGSFRAILCQNRNSRVGQGTHSVYCMHIYANNFILWPCVDVSVFTRKTFIAFAFAFAVGLLNVYIYVYTIYIYVFRLALSQLICVWHTLDWCVMSVCLSLCVDFFASFSFALAFSFEPNTRLFETVTQKFTIHHIKMLTL